MFLVILLWYLGCGINLSSLLFSGLFIEPPADCAVRELKEETGIKLDADEIKNCPQIDLLQNDNLNPHKGKGHHITTCSLPRSHFRGVVFHILATNLWITLKVTPLSHILTCEASKPNRIQSLSSDGQ